DIAYVSSEIAKLCFSNNVYDFNILQSEPRLIANLENNEEITDIDTPESFLDALYKIFLDGITIEDEDFDRLRNPAARNFYAMILEWRTTGSSYKQMIAKFMRYWKGLKHPII